MRALLGQKGRYNRDIDYGERRARTSAFHPKSTPCSQLHCVRFFKWPYCSPVSFVAGPEHLFDEVDAFERERGLVDEAHQERKLVRAYRLSSVLLGDPQHRNRLSARQQRLEEPFRRGKRARSSTGGDF